MSTEQQRTELLTAGYVNKTYNGNVPIQLIKLMQLFYDEYLYWMLKDRKLEQFMSAQNGEKIIYAKPFKIEGIEFDTVLFPNGKNHNYDGMIMIGFKVKHFPVNIEYIDYYQEINCEPLNCATKSKRLCHATKSKAIFRSWICPLSQLKEMKSVCFNCMINIKYIKYEKNCNKIDYYSPINKMRKYYTFTWNISNLWIEKCKKMVYKQFILSDNFENDNWCLMFFPNGVYVGAKGYSSVYLNCLSFPYTIHSMDVKFTVTLDGQTTERTTNMSYGVGTAQGHTLMPFVALEQKESLLLTITLQIMNIYDSNDQIINESEWEKHGIFSDSA